MRRVLAGLRALFSRHQADADLDEEIRAYIEAQTEALVAAGMAPADAAREARLRIGSLAAAKDAVRDVGWESWVESLWQDMRYALRGLSRSPGFTVAAMLTLALGIGANTAVFSLVNGLVLKALPVEKPDELAILSTRNAVAQGYPAGWGYPIWEQIRAHAPAGSAAAWSVFPQRFDLARGGESDFVDGDFVSGDYFALLGIRAQLGRVLTADDDVTATPVAVIGHAFWQRRLHGAPDVVGRTLFVNQVPVTIVGVLPAEFLGLEVGRALEIALPIGSVPEVMHDATWTTHAGRAYLGVVLRMNPGESIATAEATLRGLQRRIVDASLPPQASGDQYREALLSDPFVLTPGTTGTSELRRQYLQPLGALLAIAASVLLIACVNLANLTLARAAARQPELGIRTALGAGRRRLAQQLLIEHAVLTVLGAGAGLALAAAGSRLLVTLLATGLDRVVLDVAVDWRVIVFTAVLTVVVTLLIGLGPALGSRLAPPRGWTRSSARSGPSRTPARSRARGTLIAVQVALSLVLVIVAGLFIRTFERVANVPLGFDSDRVLVARVDMSRAAVDPADRTAFIARLAATVGALPDVERAAASLTTPVSRATTLVTDVAIRGKPVPPLQARRVVVNLVTAEWFSTYGRQVRQGRPIDARDHAGSPRVAVVNDAFVRRFMPGVDPLGEALVDGSGSQSATARPAVIVGVVGDAVDQVVRDGPWPTIYQPLTQWGAQWTVEAPPLPAEIDLSIRARAGSPSRLAPDVAGALTSVDPNLAFSFRALDRAVSDARHQERLVAWLSGAFALLALALAAVGVYGVTAYSAARRRTEMGIRMALGAQRREVLALTLTHSAVMVAGGVVLGLAVAGGATQYVAGMLFGITPLDPVTWVAAPVLLAGVALVAALIPARQAAAIDPMSVIRSE